MLACVLYAISTVLIEPVNVIPGSILGISMIAHAVAGVHIRVVNLAMNVPLLRLCAFVYGKKILIYTILVIISTSGMIDGFAEAFWWFPLTDLWMLSAIGGVLMGFGGGLIMRYGGTMGGTSALGTLLRKPFPRLRLDLFMFATDAVILTDGATLLYSFCMLLVSILYAAVCYLIMGRFTEQNNKRIKNDTENL